MYVLEAINDRESQRNVRRCNYGFEIGILLLYLEAEFFLFGQTDRYDEANGRFSKNWEKRLKSRCMFREHISERIGHCH